MMDIVRTHTYWCTRIMQDLPDQSSSHTQLQMNNKQHTINIPDIFHQTQYEGVLLCPQPDQEGNKLQESNSGFIQHTPHEAHYTSQPFVLIFASQSKKFRKLSVQPGLRGRNDLHVGRKMANFQLFFFSTPTGADPENRMGYEDTGSPGSPVSSGL